MALENLVNGVNEEPTLVSEDEDGEITYRKDIIFIEDQDIGARVRELRDDYQKPDILDTILRHQATKLTSWPAFERKVLQDDGERVFCSIQGSMRIALVSPVFQQNLYNGVFDDLDPEDVPHEIDLFHMEELFEEYPLLEEANEYILTGEINKGDCLYVPALFWMQTENISTMSSHLTFYYEEASKFSNLIFNGIRIGVHKND